MQIIDNINTTVKEDLQHVIRKGSANFVWT